MTPEPLAPVKLRIPRLPLRAVALVSFLSLPGAPLAAQQGQSVLTLLDVGGRTLDIGAEFSGTLSTRDWVAPDGKYVQAWALDGQAGESVAVDLLSDEFDPYLIVVGPGLGVGLVNDDGGEGLNSHLCVEFPESGRFLVVASSYGSGVGGYRVRVEETEPGEECAAVVTDDEVSMLGELPTDDRSLADGQVANGSLDADDPQFYGSPVEAWAVQGSAGSSMTYDLHSSDFDAYLYLTGPGLEFPLENDDGAGACDSRITVTFPQTGTYRVVASSLGAGEGTYTLEADREPGPVLDQACGAWGATDDVLSDLPIVGEVGVGSEVEGHLEAGDQVYLGSYVQAWELEGTAGQPVAVELLSDVLDAYLFVRGPGVDASNDDSPLGGTLNSRLCLVFPETATYRVIASSIDLETAGPYTVRVEPVPGPGEPGACGTYAGYQMDAAAFLEGLSTDGRRVSVGETVTGILEAGDETIPSDGTYIEAWALDGAAGQEVVIELLSEDFDPYLHFYGPGLTETLYDDDGAGNLDSRICTVLPETGSYIIAANTFAEGSTGYYEIRVTEGACPSGAATGTAGGGVSFVDPQILASVPAEGELPLGFEIDGELRAGAATVDGSYAQAWTVEGSQGDRVIFETASEDFDTFLYVVGPGLGQPLEDDDGGDGLNSRIALDLPESGTYTVIVSSYGSDVTGTYRLRALRRR